MGHYSYMSLDALKANFRDTATVDDVIFRRVLENVSEMFDLECSRTFQPYLATKIYTSLHGSWLDLPDDLIAITSIKTDEDDDYVYENTWAATDYALWPYNAPSDRQPYSQITTKPNGTYSFPGSAQGVQIVGKWGWFEDLELIASLAAEAMDASETGMDVDAGTDFDVLDTIKVDSEQMYITAISTNTLTVVRGVNGTTAATHLDNAVIYRYRYPGPIVEACGLQAARIFQRAKAPLGVIGGGDVGFIRVSRLDSDVQQLLSYYKIPVFGGVQT